MKERRRIKQTQPGRPLGGVLVVFHWQRRYALANFHRAALEERDMTDAEIAEDGQAVPRYSFTAYRVPEGNSADREKLRDLLASAGFIRGTENANWVALEDGTDHVLRLKLALKSQGIVAVHYKEIPDLLLVPISVEGEL